MNQEAAQDKPQQAPQIELQKIYLKDVSLETPNSPKVFTEEWKPNFNLQINTATHALADPIHEVVLSITVTAKVGEKTAYLAEIQQAGIFALKGFSKDQIGPILGAFCPNTLFPYAREAIDSLLVKGGFPPLHLNPINFDALYMQHLQSQRNPPAPPTITH
ncbi:MAG: protein-export chaperone SecB [Gammaproteobacteria bacterium]